MTFAGVHLFKKSDLAACWSSNPTEKEAQLKVLSDAQFAAFYSSFKMMAVWHAVELVLGKILFKTLFKGAIVCAGEGTEWHYRSGAAHLFLVLHILGSMQALGMTRKVFIVAGKAAGIVPKTEKDLKKEAKKNK